MKLYFAFAISWDDPYRLSDHIFELFKNSSTRYIYLCSDNLNKLKNELNEDPLHYIIFRDNGWIIDKKPNDLKYFKNFGITKAKIAEFLETQAPAIKHKIEKNYQVWRIDDKIHQSILKLADKFGKCNNDIRSKKILKTIDDRINFRENILPKMLEKHLLPDQFID